MPRTSSAYSDTWFSLFMDSIDPERTEAEAAFVARHLPQPTYSSILDLCCGTGRHIRHLAAMGYQIVGVDLNSPALDKARDTCPPDTQFIHHDMRHLDELPGIYDSVINLWSSFGYFDEDTNASVLRQIRNKLNLGGRFVLDMYNREAMLRLPRAETTTRAGTTIHTERRWSGKRLTVTVTYEPSRKADTFEWHLYTPEEIVEVAAEAGLLYITSCAWFDEALSPSAEHARMQFVFERTSRVRDGPVLAEPRVPSH